mmetsp:Transcript_20973/g.58576  ORF Transcript_20973/g.58576 Transcript_20973/m.58576 type:complete len:593 (-) Transcript_20973:224-2002(-)
MGPHGLDPSLDFGQVLCFGASVDHGIERENAWRQAPAVHPLEPKLSTLHGPAARTCIDHRVVCDNIRLDTGFLHFAHPRLRPADVVGLGARMHHSGIAGDVSLGAQFDHALEPILCARSFALTRVQADERVEHCAGGFDARRLHSPDDLLHAPDVATLRKGEHCGSICGGRALQTRRFHLCEPTLRARDVPGLGASVSHSAETRGIGFYSSGILHTREPRLGPLWILRVHTRHQDSVVRVDVWFEARGPHLFEEHLYTHYVSALAEGLDRRIEANAVRLLPATPHVLQELHTTESVTAPRVNVHQKVEGDRVGHHFVLPHLVEKRLRLLDAVASSAVGTQNHVVAHGVSLNASGGHASKPGLRNVHVAILRQHVDNCAETVQRRHDASGSHRLDPIFRALELPVSRARIDDCIVANGIRLDRALRNHRAQPALGALAVGSFRARVEHRAVADDVGLHACGDHPRKPFFCTDDITDAGGRIDHCVVTHHVGLNANGRHPRDDLFRLGDVSAFRAGADQRVEADRIGRADARRDQSLEPILGRHNVACLGQRPDECAVADDAGFRAHRQKIIHGCFRAIDISCSNRREELRHIV